ncbi:unnamed protein product [Leptosia nina]|uniref:Uncharacterized protein n=1 Tax=Leptosia nina TaxID=320188 RepID=A0AAV1JQX9_9NEOP
MSKGASQMESDKVIKREVTVPDDEDRPQRETRLTSIIDQLRHQNMSRGYRRTVHKGYSEFKAEPRCPIPSALFSDLRFIGSESNCAGAPDACLLSRP